MTLANKMYARRNSINLFGVVIVTNIECYRYFVVISVAMIVVIQCQITSIMKTYSSFCSKLNCYYIDHNPNFISIPVPALLHTRHSGRIASTNHRWINREHDRQTNNKRNIF